MSKIIVKIEISDVDKWAVDWDNNKYQELKQLKFDIESGISSSAGIDLDNIDAQLEYQEEQK